MKKEFCLYLHLYLVTETSSRVSPLSKFSEVSDREKSWDGGFCPCINMYHDCFVGVIKMITIGVLIKLFMIYYKVIKNDSYEGQCVVLSIYILLKCRSEKNKK